MPTTSDVPSGPAEPGRQRDHAARAEAAAAWRVAATPHAAPEAAFNAYSDSGQGWTGGDSTYAQRLPDGRVVWAFSDTFVGPVNADGSRPETTPFINNSFVVQTPDESIHTVTGGTKEHPAPLIPSPADGWYWLGGRTLNGDNLDVMALRFQRTGEGMWDWQWVSNNLARFDSQTLALKELIPLPSDANVQWSAWVLQEQESTYVYGVEDSGEAKYLHIARVAGGDLAQPWEYWTGDDWSNDEAAAARVLGGVANEHSVTPWKDGYLLVTHDTSEAFNPRILGYTAATPTGPFTNPVELYRTPETGTDPQVFTYNSHVQPHLSSDDSLLISYNVNTLDLDALFRAGGTSIYRPRFVRVELETDSPNAPEPYGRRGRTAPSPRTGRER
ncbi:DUF5005 domain-containing protein [Kribbella solani]|uniref:DUF4185 domain-containing protein n=1 Tax=Kribbella solani TaxID=236067 RepID=A0A841DYL4_9ACTN|nr:DUF5005 domain-containing protein [Kribbella solani]MBB5981856.1 hypothetical protein [Kribbella solani]